MNFEEQQIPLEAAEAQFRLGDMPLDDIMAVESSNMVGIVDVNLHVGRLMAEVQQLKHENQVLTEENSIIKRVSEDRERFIALLKEAVTKRRRDNDELRAKVMTEQDANEKLKTENKLLQGELKTERENNEVLQQENETLQSEIHRMTVDYEENDGSSECSETVLTNHVEQLESDLFDAHQRLEIEREESQAKISELKLKVLETGKLELLSFILERDVKVKAGLIETLRKENKGLCRVVKTWKEEHATVQEESITLKLKVNHLENTVRESKETLKLEREKLKKAESSLEMSKVFNEDLTEDLDKCEMGRDEAAKWAQLQETERKSLEKAKQQGNEELEEMKKKYEGQTETLIEIKQGMDMKI